MTQAINVEEAMTELRYQNELKRINRSKVILSDHAIGRYYEHMYLRGYRQDWERMPYLQLNHFMRSPEWRRSKKMVRELLERADWRVAVLSKQEKLEKMKLHPGGAFYFKCYRCTFVVVRDWYIPGAYTLITLRFMNIAE